PAGSAAPCGRDRRPCGSRSATGRPRRTTSTARWPPSSGPPPDVHRPTLEVYERIGADYVVRRGVQDPDRAAALGRAVLDGRILALGCAPGQYLPLLGRGAVGADAAQAMVDAARHVEPTRALVRCDLGNLPFGRAAFAGVWASK